MTFSHSPLEIAFVCCCDFCFHIRTTLGVVGIYPVFKINIIPRDKNLGRLSLVKTATTAGQSWPEKHFFNHANDSFEVCGVASSCWNHWLIMTSSLHQPSAVQKLQSTWTYQSLLIVTQCSLSSPNRNPPMMPFPNMV